MEKSIYSKKEVNDFIIQLKKNKISFFDVPEELRTNKTIVDIERQLGLRKAGKRGYDVINDCFFVEEEIISISSEESCVENISTFFPDFDSYNSFLDGDIYENACYYQYDFSGTEVDLKRISNKAFVKTIVDDYSLEVSKEELEKYELAEQTKIICKKWIEKFNACDTYEKFDKCVENYRNSEISRVVKVHFFFFQYIFEDIHDKNKFDVIMEYVSHGKYLSSRIVNGLCLIYDPEKVFAAYHYPMDAKRTSYKYKKKLRDTIDLLYSGSVDISECCYFDSDTHYYCVEWFGGSFFAKRYFENFELFIKYRKGDLTNCDLSGAIGLDLKLYKYKINSTTRLPFNVWKKIKYILEKSYVNGEFKVSQTWYDPNNNIVRQYEHKFCYFFDFIAFLNGDLSNADLLFCDGLKNLKDTTGLNFSRAKLTSEISEKLGIRYETNDFNTKMVQSFSPVMENERETLVALQTEREPTLYLEECINNEKVYYISDIHLLHRIQQAGCKSRNDIVYLIGNIVKGILQEELSTGVLLIGGDTASEFYVFELFVKILRQALDEGDYDNEVIFLLGNHELWGFQNRKLKSIIHKYEMLLDKYHMYLLQNNIFYRDKNNCLKKVSESELLAPDKDALRMRLRTSRFIIFGGLAFSGYNETFNADNGIYRGTVDRKEEIEETKKFEKLYDVVCENLSDRNLIVFTHTPKKDWCKNSEPRKQFVYVNGHTHRNYFFDDGEYRIYADNQVGYHNENPHLKYFYIENEYDYFSDYEDGIYEITQEQYREFYCGKNIQMTLNRKLNILYMLKKNGFYCFIHKSKRGVLQILNGGAIQNLNEKDIHYYYNNMDKEIAYIERPLNSFTRFQEQISNEIKMIGGIGAIHGCIIDIDFYCHVYVNPIDMKVTGYWAQDILYKEVYPNIPSLLKIQCPELYDRYTKLLRNDKDNQLAIRDDIVHDLTVLPNNYLETDIYRISRGIKKMQRLRSKILSTWYELDNNESISEIHKEEESYNL